MKRFSIAKTISLMAMLACLAAISARAQGAADLTNSTITAGSTSIVANGLASTPITVQLKDESSVNLTTSGGHVTLTTTNGRLGGVTDNGNGTYTATLTAAMTVCQAEIDGFLNGAPIIPFEIVDFIQGPASLVNSTLTAGAATLAADGSSATVITVQLKDGAGADAANNVGVVKLAASVGRLSSVEIEPAQGKFLATYTAPIGAAGTPAVISATVAGQALNATASIALTAPPANGAYQSIASGNWSSAAIWEVANAGVYAAAGAPPTDANGVITIRGGHTVTVSAPTTADQLVVEPTGGKLVVDGTTLTLNDSLNTIFGTLELKNAATVRSLGIDVDGGTLQLDGTSAVTALAGDSVGFVHTYNTATVSVPSTANFDMYFYVENGTTTLTSSTASGALTGGLNYVGRSNDVPATLILAKDFTINGTFTVRPRGTLQGTGVLNFTADNADYLFLLTNNGTITADVVFQSLKSNLINLQGSTSPGAEYVWNNVTVDNAAGVQLRYPNGNPDAVINGTLTLANGTFSNSGDFGTQKIRLGDNAKIVRSGGSLTTAPLFGQYIDVEYKGGSPISTGNELPQRTTVLKTLTITNTAGVTLSDPITVNTSVACSGGMLHTSNETLTLASGATVTESAGKNIDGILSITKPVGTGASTFGGIGVSMDASGGDDAGNVTVTRYTGTEGIFVNNIAASWKIKTTTGVPSGRNVTMTWLPEYNNSKNLTLARKWSSTDGGATWTDLSNADQDLTGGSIIAASTAGAGVNTIYTVSDNTGPLPVELTSFSSAVHGARVVLSWKTATETNNYGFEVERSASGSAQWRTVGFVEGAGTSNAPKDYSFVESKLAPGTYFYRLKQIDRDGKFEYSRSVETAVMNVPEVFSLSQNYPNPFNPSTTIAFGLPENSTVSLKVYDMIGREVAALIGNGLTAGYYSLPFDGTRLSSGVYFYRLTAAHGAAVFTETKRFVLMK